MVGRSKATSASTPVDICSPPERALEQARGGHREEAVRTVRDDVWRLADTAGTAANDLVLYDVRAAESAAQRIESARQHGNPVPPQLDALCALVATIAPLATVRAGRQMHRVQHANPDPAQTKGAQLE